MNKNACVIALTHLGDRKVIFKNRDRNYLPRFKIIHRIADNGTEILYFQDTVSGWIEGINEYGICITNSALAVKLDEKEGKKRAPLYSADSWKFLEALECKSLLEALNKITNYRKGIRGHTILTDQKNTFVVEQTSDHKAKVEEIVDRNFVRSNHGVRHQDAGYTQGEDLESSRRRRDKTLEVLESKIRYPMDSVKKLYQQRMKDISSPFNVVRRADMFTSNQFIFEPSKKKMTIITIDDDSVYEGYEKQFRGPAKCKVCAKKVFRNKKGDLEVRNEDLKKLVSKPRDPRQDTLKVFAYGSLMSDPIEPESICNERRAFINGVSRELNMQHKGRNHLVFGTTPCGRIEGVLYEYPQEVSGKVLTLLDKRRGYAGKGSNLYLRTEMRAFTKQDSQGVLCFVYITNEESDAYQGSLSVNEAEGLLSQDPKFREYFETTLFALSAIGGQDTYMNKIKGI